jgi:hypothetical protein
LQHGARRDWGPAEGLRQPAPSRCSHHIAFGPASCAPSPVESPTARSNSSLDWVVTAWHVG